MINDPTTTTNIVRVGNVDTSASDPGLHISPRPVEYGTIGHYHTSMVTGTMGANAGALSEILQIRCINPKVVILSLQLEHFRSLATGFAAGNFLFDVIRANNWTGAGSGGQLPIQSLVRMGMASASTQVRISTTLPLVTGTKELSPTPYRAIRGIVSTAVNAHQLGSISATANVTVGYPMAVPLIPECFPAGYELGGFNWDYNNKTPGMYPIELENNEGIIVRATVPGTGTWEAAFTLDFCEVNDY